MLSEKFQNLLEIHSSFLPQSLLKCRMLNSKLKVKVDIVPFADLNSLNVLLNLIDPP